MPNFKVLESPDQTALNAFLSQRAESSMFMLSNLRRSGLTYEDRPFHGVYVAALEGDEIVGVAAHYWNGNITLQLPDPYAEKTLDMLVRHTGRSVDGLLGPSEQVQQARVILELSETPTRYASLEKLYALALAGLNVPLPLSQGSVTCRNVSEADLSWLIDWHVDFKVQALNMADTPELRERCIAEERARLTHEDSWLLEDAGQPVSYSNFSATLPDMVQIGGVWTPPEFRSRGYARCVVAGSLLKARENGVQRAILFTEDYNIPAQKAYEALNFRQIGEYSIVMFQPPAIDAP
jgi:uncharacterized protein